MLIQELANRLNNSNPSAYKSMRPHSAAIAIIMDNDDIDMTQMLLKHPWLDMINIWKIDIKAIRDNAIDVAIWDTGLTKEEAVARCIAESNGKYEDERDVAIALVLLTLYKS